MTFADKATLKKYKVRKHFIIGVVFNIDFMVLAILNRLVEILGTKIGLTDHKRRKTLIEM